MPLTSSGQIDLNSMHVEAGGTTGTECSMNDADIRGLISKGAAAQMGFNEWYGASAIATPQNTSSFTSIPYGSTSVIVGGYKFMYAHDNGDFQVIFNNNSSTTMSAVSTDDGASWGITTMTYNGSQGDYGSILSAGNAQRDYYTFGSAGGVYTFRTSGKFSIMNWWLYQDNGVILQIPNSQNVGQGRYVLARDQSNKTGQIIGFNHSPQVAWQWNGNTSSSSGTITSSNVTTFSMPATANSQYMLGFTDMWKKGNDLFVIGSSASSSTTPILAFTSSNGGSSYSSTTIRTRNTSTEINHSPYIDGLGHASAIDQANDDYYLIISVTNNSMEQRFELWKTTASNKGTSWTNITTDMVGDVFGRAASSDYGSIRDIDVYGGCWVIAWTGVTGTNQSYSAQDAYTLLDGGWGSSGWVIHATTPYNSSQTTFRKVCINSNKKALGLELNTLRRFY